MAKINYTGIRNLSEIEKTNLKGVIERELTKAERKSKDIQSFQVKLKIYKSEGKRSKYDVQVKAEFPKESVTAREDGWDIRKTSHKAVKRLMKELEKRFKKESSKKTLAKNKLKIFNRYLRKKFIPSKEE